MKYIEIFLSKSANQFKALIISPHNRFCNRANLRRLMKTTECTVSNKWRDKFWIKLIGKTIVWEQVQELTKCLKTFVRLLILDYEHQREFYSFRNLDRGQGIPLVISWRNNHSVECLPINTIISNRGTTKNNHLWKNKITRTEILKIGNGLQNKTIWTVLIGQMLLLLIEQKHICHLNMH